MIYPRILLLAALASSLTGCMASVGTSGAVSVPPDARQSCDTHCKSIGMGLGAVAIMANNVGCICEVTPRPTQAQGTAVSPAVSAGMATIVIQEAARQAQAAAAAHK